LINSKGRRVVDRRVVPLAATLLAALTLTRPAPALSLDGEGPLPKNVKAASSHAPFASRDCVLCHQLKKDQAAPEAGDALCLSCHEDAKSHTHAPRNCTRCHNSHESARPKLLRADMSRCKDCHAK
jgi:predicted CXXCH cytochrome family protein